LERQVITGVGNQVVILGDANAEELGVWVGDPQIGEWGFLPLDTNGISGNVRVLAVASNETEALVVGIEWTDAVLYDEDAVLQDEDPEPYSPGISIAQYLIWMVDIEAATAERNALPSSGEWADSVEATADWYAGSWIVALAGNRWIGEGDGWTSDNPVLISPDGKSWTETRVIETDADGNPIGSIGSLVSLTGGESSIVATLCHFGGDEFLVSTDGVAWAATTKDYIGHRSTYSEALGFVVVHTTVMHSPDGQAWTSIPNSEWAPSFGPGGSVRSNLNLAASNSAVLLATDDEPGLWLYTKP
jgi:hypothetical protein